MLILYFLWPLFHSKMLAPTTPNPTNSLLSPAPLQNSRQVTTPTIFNIFCAPLLILTPSRVRGKQKTLICADRVDHKSHADVGAKD
ncbi:hypothetical protein B0H19DRAFT_1156418 [Mycena capillaripes]|nr:hypothetical protein B0H19DRAFT_1156418 [Mycena capillaripes]